MTCGPAQLTFWICAAFVSHFSLPSFSVIESRRRKTWATDIFVREDWLALLPVPELADAGLSEENPVGEFMVVPDSSGEKATPLEVPVPPPPPPLPPPPATEPAAEAR